jgi:hypothetical protein
MRIDQRNAGAAVTVNANSQFFPVDRWFGAGQATDGVFTLQQSTDTPTGSGFVNSVKATVTTADASIGSTQGYYFGQIIEGLNFSDLMWGTANAKTVTISFWVKSSLTGTFGGVLTNSAFDRSYPFTYIISASNTWEQKTVTIAGDTTGTWLTTNGVGLRMYFSFGAGSTYTGTAGVWAATSYLTATGSVSLISTNGATFFMTGVQLEKGSTATSFDYRDYQSEFARCQRYYYQIQATSSTEAFGYCYTTNSSVIQFTFPVTMRAVPTSANVNAASWVGYTSTNSGSAVSSFTWNTSGTNSASLIVVFTATAGTPTRVASGASGYIGFIGAEL